MKSRKISTKANNPASGQSASFAVCLPLTSVVERHQVLIVLVGPKGSGKSHIGRLLERDLGVRFFHVEPLWMAYYAECWAAGRDPCIAEGISVVHPKIAEALGTHEHLCVETTGASSASLPATHAIKSQWPTMP